MIEKNQKNSEQLRQIAEILLLNGMLTDCSGLVHGKTGIAIFFFHYAKYTDNELFEDYAADLIEEIRSQIHINSMADYEVGIAGIGVGINYLIQNNFLTCEEDVFEDFDARIYRAVMYDPWQNFSLYEGLTGFGRYWMMRLESAREQAQECLLRIVGLIEEKFHDVSENEQIDVCCFLQDLKKVSDFNVNEKWLKSVNNNLSFIRFGDSIVGNIVRMYQRSHYFIDIQIDDVNDVLKHLPDTEKPPTSMGLLTGNAGEGMLRLTAHEPSIISWMSLL